MKRITGIIAAWAISTMDGKNMGNVNLKLEDGSSRVITLSPDSIPVIKSVFYTPMGRHCYLKETTTILEIVFPQDLEVGGVPLMYDSVMDKYFNPQTGEEIPIP